MQRSSPRSKEADLSSGHQNGMIFPMRQKVTFEKCSVKIDVVHDYYRVVAMLRSDLSVA